MGKFADSTNKNWLLSTGVSLEMAIASTKWPLHKDTSVFLAVTLGYGGKRATGWETCRFRASHHFGRSHYAGGTGSWLMGSVSS